jgi:hypothetical protein
MHNKLLRYPVLACISLFCMANAASAQPYGYAQTNELLVQKIAVGVGVWIVTAILAYVAWAVTKLIAKVGVIALPIIAGIGVAAMLPSNINNDIVVATSIPFVIWGTAITLVCYVYANFFNVERRLDKLEQEQGRAVQSTPSTPPAKNVPS